MSLRIPGSETELCDELLRVFRQFSSPNAGNSPLQSWLVVRQFERQQGLPPAQALRRCLVQELARLAEQNAEGATILRRHYVDGVEVHTIARELAQVEGTINKKQRQAIAQLAALLTKQEDEANSAKERRIAKRLGTSVITYLFGAAAQAGQVNAYLHANGPPWLIAIDGIGGIGKTAFADWLLRTQAVGARWDDVAWITARPQGYKATSALHTPEAAFSTRQLFDTLYEQLLAVEDSIPPSALERERQVRTVLKTFPHLIVVDDFQYLADGDSLPALLLELASPSKFLLTTRCSLDSIHGAFALRMCELEIADAIALLHWEAEQRNLPALAAATDEDLASIYAVTGGNPLALRLLASQTHVHSLSTVLDMFQHASSRRVEALYVYIYRHAWEMLDVPARQVLLSMGASDQRGTNIALLHSATGLSISTLHNALDQLVALNLVDSQGSLRERYYSVHNLTRTFLRHQALLW